MTTILRSKLHTIPVALAAAALLVAGCSSFEFSSTGPGEESTTLAVFVEIPEGQVSPSAQPALSVRVEDGADVLNLVDIKMAVDQIELGRTSGECVDSTNFDDGDACREAVVMPAVLQLPVEMQNVPLTNALVAEPGTYDRLEFDLHLVSEGDAALLAPPHNFTTGTSVQVRGTMNGSAVDVDFSSEAELSIALNPPIVLEEGQSKSATLVVDVESWFRADDGSLIDPIAAANNAELAAQIEANIAESLSARGE